MGGWQVVQVQEVGAGLWLCPTPLMGPAPQHFLSLRGSAHSGHLCALVMEGGQHGLVTQKPLGGP